MSSLWLWLFLYTPLSLIDREGGGNVVTQSECFNRSFDQLKKTRKGGMPNRQALIVSMVAKVLKLQYKDYYAGNITYNR